MTYVNIERGEITMASVNMNGMNMMNSLLSGYSSVMKSGNVSGGMTARNIAKAMEASAKNNLGGSGSGSTGTGEAQLSKNAQNFYNGFYARTDAMSYQAESIGKTEFKVDKLAEDGSNKAAVQRQTDALYSKVQSFADAVNNSNSYLRSNAGKSPVIKGMAGSMAKVLNEDSKALAEIGISVDSSGRMRVDKGEFSKALQESPDKVNSLMKGSDGLSGKVMSEAKSAVNVAKTTLPQTSPAFSAFTTGSTYTGKGQSTMLRFSSGIGLLLNQLV